MTTVKSFDDIREEFLATVAKVVWCNVATVDTQGRPRSRVLHPMWEGSTGWIITGRQSLKAKHLEDCPYISLAYIADPFKPIYVDATAEWIDDMSEKARIWNLFASTPEPYGYDPTPFFGSADKPSTGILKVTPHQIEMYSLMDNSNKKWQA